LNGEIDTSGLLEIPDFNIGIGVTEFNKDEDEFEKAYQKENEDEV